MIKVENTMQLICVLRQTYVQVAYIPDFKMKFTNQKQLFISSRELVPLFEITSYRERPYSFYDEGGSLFGYSQGQEFKTQFIFKLDETGKKLQLSHMKRIGGDPHTYRHLEALAEVSGSLYLKKGNRWIARNVEVSFDRTVCIAKTTYPFYLTMLHTRGEHINLFFKMGGSNFKKPYSHPSWKNDGPPKYEARTVFIGIWKSILFGFRVTTSLQSPAVPKFSEILDFIERFHGSYLDGAAFASEKESVQLFSANGDETVVVLIADNRKAVFYSIFRTATFVRQHKIIELNRTKFKKFDDFVGNGCTLENVDFDSSRGQLIVRTMKGLQQLYYYITLQEDDSKDDEWIKKAVHGQNSDVMLDQLKYDFCPIGTFEFDVMQVMNGRMLYRVGNELKVKDGDDNVVTLTKNAVPELQALLYFPLEKVPEKILTEIRKKEYNFEAIHGVAGCTVFISNDLSPISFQNNINETGCNTNKNIKVFANGPRLIVVWEKAPGRASSFTLKTEVSKAKKNGTFDYYYQMSGKEVLISFNFKKGTFNQIFAKEDKIHYRVDADDVMFAWTPIHIFHETRYKSPILSYCPAECDLVSAFYEPKEQDLFYEVKTGGNKRMLIGYNIQRVSQFSTKRDWTQVVDDGKILSIIGSTFTFMKEEKVYVVDMEESTSRPREAVIPKVRFASIFSGTLVIKPARTAKIVRITEAAHEANDISIYEPTAAPTSEPNVTTLAPPPLILRDANWIPQKQELREPIACPPFYKRDFFIALVLKVLLLDGLLLILLVTLVLIHRMMIVPARRRYKIIRGLQQAHKKKALRQRAKKRLLKLNIIRRKLEREQRKKAGSRSSSSSSSSQNDQMTGIGAGEKLKSLDNEGPSKSVAPLADSKLSKA